MFVLDWSAPASGLISARGSEWMGNSQVTSVTMVALVTMVT